MYIGIGKTEVVTKFNKIFKSIIMDNGIEFSDNKFLYLQKSR